MTGIKTDCYIQKAFIYISMFNEKILSYRITRLIGSGGMAKVYEAEHVNLGTKVAIKLLDPVLAEKGNLKERFRNEARIMASLRHENIVQVLDYYEDDSTKTFAIIMELLEGESLSDFIKKRGALSEQLVYDLMTKILKAFGYAHGKGLIHRDVKPANIFITNDKNIKILDFGIAKLIGQDAELTGTGMQMGTPMYMSPEQVKDSKHLDKRSDIYSLGVMMYFMLTGKAPYDTNTNSNFDILNKIVNEPLPNLRDHSHLNSIIQKATTKEASKRIQSCEEFLELLRNDSVCGERTIVDKDTKNVDNKFLLNLADDSYIYYDKDDRELKYKGDLPGLVMFYTSRCGKPCRSLEENLKKIEKEFKGRINIFKVDLNDFEYFADHWNIKNIPALLFVPKEGKWLISEGYTSVRKLRKFSKKILIKKEGVTQYSLKDWAYYSFGRIIALLIDFGIILGISTFVISKINLPVRDYEIVYAIVGGIYFVFLESFFSQTLGKMFVYLKVSSSNDSLTILSILFRNLLKITFLFLAGFLFLENKMDMFFLISLIWIIPLYTRRMQTIHDILSKTLVLPK